MLLPIKEQKTGHQKKLIDIIAPKIGITFCSNTEHAYHFFEATGEYPKLI